MRFELTVEILKKTDKAVFIDDGTIKAWIPLYQIETEDEIKVGKVITISVPEWLGERFV